MSSVKFFRDRLYLLRKLGVKNILLNFEHKLRLRSGYYKVRCRTSKAKEMGPALILAPQNSEIYPQRPTGFVGSFEKDIRGLLEGEIKIFFSQKIKFLESPDWFYDSYGQDKSHWSELSINKTRGEDVKLTWDLSRFHWIQQLACAYNAYGDKRYLELIDSWLSSWIRDNPVNQGVNWACGQECSIRIIHILNASIICEYGIFDKERLTQLVISHLTRIFPTINYAVCQDNNHVITEAAALFICGAWLEKNSDGALADAKNIMECGRRLLEDRVQKLVMQDGGFSMYSTNYHRVLLNTLGIVELWRLKLCQPAFSREYTEKCRRAIMWLYLLVNENTGMTMNLGNNDGSNPFIVQSSDFRDFRPSIQFASVLILNQRAYESSDPIDEPLLWLKVNSKLPVEKPCKVKSMVLISPESWFFLAKIYRYHRRTFLFDFLNIISAQRSRMLCMWTFGSRAKIF